MVLVPEFVVSQLQNVLVRLTPIPKPTPRFHAHILWGLCKLRGKQHCLGEASAWVFPTQTWASWFPPISTHL